LPSAAVPPASQVCWLSSNQEYATVMAGWTTRPGSGAVGLAEGTTQTVQLLLLLLLLLPLPPPLLLLACRAGRDGHPADCVLMFSPADVSKLNYMNQMSEMTSVMCCRLSGQGCCVMSHSWWRRQAQL